MTNFEKIKNMSIEKLAPLLIKFDSKWGVYETDVDVFSTYEQALKAEIEWLKTEGKNV